LEEVVMIMKSHKELALENRINTPRIYPTSRLVSRLMRMRVQPNKAIVGDNAFAHSSGIHQDGFLKHRETYEVIDPQDVGVDTSKIVLTARSGRAALKYRMENLGYFITKAELDEIYQDYLVLADEVRVVNDDHLGVLYQKIEIRKEKAGIKS
jgi:2-isopropylmalate synthase